MDGSAETQAWAPSETDGEWLEATVVSRAEDGTVTLKTNESGAEHKCTAESLYLMNMLPEDGVEDMARLNYLHESTATSEARCHFC